MKIAKCDNEMAESGASLTSAVGVSSLTCRRVNISFIEKI